MIRSKATAISEGILTTLDTGLGGEGR